MSTKTPTEQLLGLPTTDAAVVATLATLDAATAWLRSPDSCWWISLDAGVDVRVDVGSDRVDTVFHFAEGVDEHEQYAGALPGGIEFSWDRARVLAHLGPPDGSSSEHDGWEHDDYRLVVDYDAGGRIVQVTVTTA